MSIEDMAGILVVCGAALAATFIAVMRVSAVIALTRFRRMNPWRYQ